MIKKTLPPKKVGNKILTAYGGGVTCLDGVEYTAFGRDKEVKKFDEVLSMTREGSGQFKMIVGPYGIGKTFIRALFKELAIKKNFVVMSADFCNNCWLAGSKTSMQGVNMYGALLRNTAIKGESAGSIDKLLENWYLDIEDKVKESNGGVSDIEMILKELDKQLYGKRELPMYDSISGAIRNRFKELHDKVNESKSLRWLMGNQMLMAEVREAGASTRVTEDNWFDMMKTWAGIVKSAGYEGLIVIIDQCDFVLNLQQNQRRMNYEAMLTWYNAINQGVVENLSVYVLGVDVLVDDENRGVPTYGALRDRVIPPMRLQPISEIELVALLTRLKQIEEYCFDWECNVSEDQIKDFVLSELQGLASRDDCIRVISRKWVNQMEEWRDQNVINPEIDSPRAIADEIEDDGGEWKF